MKMATGSNIRTLRNLAGLTLEQLSVLSGVEVGTISALENRDSARSKYFTAIAQAFGISTDDLLGFALSLVATIAAVTSAIYGAHPSVSIALIGVPLMSAVRAIILRR